MTTFSKIHSTGSQPAHYLVGWIRNISPRRAGIMVLVLTIILTVATYILHAVLNYPEILLDPTSFAQSLVIHEKVTALLSFIGLLLCGILLMVISIALAQSFEDEKRRQIVLIGVASGMCWSVGALMGLILIPLWIGAHANAAQILGSIFFVFTEIVSPLLFLFWTVALARNYQAYWAFGLIGLLLVLFRSLVWGLNAILPIESGFYGTAGIANVLALLGESPWLFWLLLFGFRCLTQKSRSDGSSQEEKTGRRILKVAATIGVILLGIAFVGARTELTFTHSPELEGDGAPAEPSFVGTLVYQFVRYYEWQHPITTIKQQLTIPRPHLPLPQGVSLVSVNASGVPAQFIIALGATKDRVILYIHGGGWTVPLQDQDRVDAANLSQATGATVLLTDYRLLPDHPFPAGLQDCVTAYRWLRSQGVAASQIVIIGGSAGAHLTLTTAVALQESGEALPAALVALSPPTDFAVSGASYRTKARVDPILGNGLAMNAFAAYTNNGPADVHDPLVSPLYADLHGFPSTLLMVGTQEILLSDSIRMADQLKAANVEMKLEVWPGMFHGFQGQSYIPEARLANEQIVKFIRQHLGE